MKKLVVITGASSGIGLALAKRFSKEGYPVLMIARRAELMQKENLPNTVCRSVDVTDQKAMEKAIKEAEKIYGETDLLINCAGIMLLGDINKQDYAEWENMVDVNIKGILTGTHYVLPQMTARNSGTIINFSSIAGRKTFDNHAVYCGTKFAVHAITEAIRKEVSQSNVRLLTIAPGVVETPLLSHTTDAEIVKNYEEWKKSIENGLDTEQIADTVFFMYTMPQNVSIREVVIAKTKQAD